MSMVILFLIYQTTAMTMVLGEGNNYTFSTLAEMEGSPDALEKSEIELKDQELAAQLHLAGCVTWTMALWTFKYCILMWFARLM